MSQLLERNRLKNMRGSRRNSKKASNSSSSSPVHSSESDIDSSRRHENKLVESTTSTHTQNGQGNITAVDSSPVQEALLTSSDGGGCRIPSPSSASSVTSGRRLEWDSGADVGYNVNYGHLTRSDEQQLSTIERLALSQGRLAVFPLRSEPEGKSGQMVSANTTLPVTIITSASSHTAMAHSTPVDGFRSEAAALCATNETDFTPIIFNREKNAKQHDDKSCHISGICVKDCVTGQNDNGEEACGTRTKDKGDKRKTPVKRDFVSNLQTVPSISLIDLRKENFIDDLVEPNLQRSHSDIDLLSKHIRTNSKVNSKNSDLYNSNVAAAVPQSTSSSSATTIVNKKYVEREIADGLRNHRKPFRGHHNDAKCTENISETMHTPLSSRNARENCTVTTFTDRVLIGAENEIVGKKNFFEVETETAKDLNSPKTHSSLTCENPALNQENILECIKQRICPLIEYKGAHKKESVPRDELSVGQSNTNESNSNNLYPSQDQKSVSINTQFENLESSSTNNNGAASSMIETSNGAVETSTTVGSANSFEYVTGEVYETCVKKRHVIGKKSSFEKEKSHSPPINPITTGTKSDTTGSDALLASGASTLARDLEKSVQMLQKLVENHKSDAVLRKKLVRSVVDKLVNSNYDDDQDNNCKKSNQQGVEVPGSYIKEKAGNHIEAKTSTQSVGVGHTSTSMSSSSQRTHTGSRSMLTGNFVHKTGPRSVSLSTTSGSVSLPVPADDCSSSVGADYYSSSATTSSDKRKQMNWQYVKTHSEQVLDKQHSKSEESVLRSELIKFYEAERGNQISWIQFEIDHLTKLKQFLKGQQSLKECVRSPNEDEQKLLNRNQSRCSSAPTKTSSRSSDSTTVFATQKPGASICECCGVRNKPKIHLPSKYNTEVKQDKENAASSKAQTSKENSGFQFQQANVVNAKNKAKTNTKHLDLVIDMKVKSGDRTLVSRTEKLELSDANSYASVSPTANGKTLQDRQYTSDGSGRINVFTQTQRHQISQNEVQSSSSVTENYNPNGNILFQNTLHDGSGDAKVAKCCCQCQKELDDIKLLKSTKGRHHYVSPKHKTETVSDNSDKPCKNSQNLFKVYKIEKGKVINGTDDTQSSSVSSPAIVSENSSYPASSGNCHCSPIDFENCHPPRKHFERDINYAVKTKSEKRHIFNSNENKNFAKLNKAQLSQQIVLPHSSNERQYHTIETVSRKKNDEQKKQFLSSVESHSSKVEQHEHLSQQFENDNLHRVIRTEKNSNSGQKNQLCPCCKKTDYIENVSSLPQQSLIDGTLQEVCPCCFIQQKSSQKIVERGTLKDIPNGSITKAKSSSDCELEHAARKNTVCQTVQTENEENIDVAVINTHPRKSKSLAYILTFEPEAETSCKEREMRRKSLEVVKVKLPQKKVLKSVPISHQSSADTKYQQIWEARGEVNLIGGNVLDHSANMRNITPSEDKIYKTALQVLLQSRRPDYVKNAEERKLCIAEMAQRRERRLLKCRNHLAAGLAPPPPTPPESLGLENHVPRHRVFSQKQMRSLTRQHCRHSQKTQNKNAERKRKQDFRTNKLMAEIFAKKLQKRALKGEVNLSNSVTVISSSA